MGEDGHVRCYQQFGLRDLRHRKQAEIELRNEHPVERYSLPSILRYGGRVTIVKCDERSSPIFTAEGRTSELRRAVKRGERTAGFTVGGDRLQLSGGGIPPSPRPLDAHNVFSC